MIHILGNVGVDLSMGPVERLPSWGTEILAGTSVYRPGGAATNVALALAGLFHPQGLTLAQVLGTEGDGEGVSGRGGGDGAAAGWDEAAGGRTDAAMAAVPVRVYCALGDDRSGRDLQAQLQRAGVPDRHLERVAGEGTSLGLALVRADGERAFVTDLGALARVDEAWVRRALAAARGPGWVLATGMTLFPGLPPAVLARLFAWLRSRGLRTALDTGWDVDDWPAERVRAWREVLRHTDLFLPNEMEAEALTGLDRPDAAAQALQAWSGQMVVVKVGPRGCWTATPQGLQYHPTEPVAIPDATGAGDVFDAGVLYGLHHGWSLEQAVQLGHRVAAAVLQSRRSFFPAATTLLQDLPRSGD